MQGRGRREGPESEQGHPPLESQCGCQGFHQNRRTAGQGRSPGSRLVRSSFASTFESGPIRTSGIQARGANCVPRLCFFELQWSALRILGGGRAISRRGSCADGGWLGRGSSGAGGSRCGGGAVAHDQQRQIVGLVRAASKVLDRLENTFLKLFQRTLGLAGKNFLETRNAEKLIV